jgi:uncharacterized protein
LRALCEQADGEILATLQAKLAHAGLDLATRDLKNHLTALENDGFLLDENGRRRFRSGLLRRYWLKYMHE